MNAPVRPLRDFVLVRRDPPATKSAGGILLANLAEDVSESPEEGVVLAVGPKATEVKVGDRVLIGSFAGFTFKVDGEPVVLVRESAKGKGNHILAVLE
jgi:co-chaperonin GroES (HSP10)